MSSFIANQISFSKDLKTFKVKGGDNNIIPRFNTWSNEIPIKYLYLEVHGGMIQLNNRGHEKLTFVNHFIDNYKKFDGNFFEEFNNDNKKAIEFNNQFIKDFTDELKKVSNKKEYIVKIRSGEYVSKRIKKSVYPTYELKFAKKFPKYVALDLAEQFSHINATAIYLT